MEGGLTVPTTQVISRKRYRFVLDALPPKPRIGFRGFQDVLPICAWLASGGTRIRTGDTMIFRSVPKPAVHRHRSSWAVPKRFLEVTNPREPSPNAVDRHAGVVGLWWTQGVPKREDSERWTSPQREMKAARFCLLGGCSDTDAACPLMTGSRSCPERHRMSSTVGE